MIELSLERVPAPHIQTTLHDCRDRGADYTRDRQFTTIKPELRLALWEEQQGLCVYCEQRLPSKTEMRNHRSLGDAKKTRIEHIRAQATSPAQRFDYENLALSCSAQKHCDRQKDNKTLPLLPSPRVNQNFTLSIDGKLSPAALDNKTGKFRAQRETIEDILGLNAPALVQKRREILKWLSTIANSDEELDDFIDAAEFPFTLREYFGGGRHDDSSPR